MRILMVLLFVFAFFTVDEANATQEVTLEDNALVVRENDLTTIRVPGIPNGLSLHDAFKLATGRLNETIVPHEVLYSSSLNPPFFTSSIVHVDKVITYNKDAGWITLATMRDTEEQFGIVGGFVLLWLPVLVIAIVSLVYVLNRWNYNDLVVLYVLVFAGIITAMIVPATWSFVTLSVGTISYIIGATKIAPTFFGKNDPPDLFMGGLWGTVVGLASNIVPMVLALSQNHESLLRYGTFLLAAEIGSFVLALLVKHIKGKLLRTALA